MIRVVCTDADGVLNDLEAYQNWMVQDYFTRRGKPVPTVKDPEAYDIADIYELPKLLRQRIWLRYFRRYCLEYGPRSQAFGVLKAMQAARITVHIVTARAFATHPVMGPIARRWFEQWLAANSFTPGEIIYCPEKGSGPAKAEAARALRADVFIEDKKDNFSCLLNVCHTVGIRTAYNRDFAAGSTPYRFYMVDGFDAVPEIIKELDV